MLPQNFFLTDVMQCLNVSKIKTFFTLISFIPPREVPAAICLNPADMVRYRVRDHQPGAHALSDAWEICTLSHSQPGQYTTKKV